jgi:hypothetical protein
MLIVQEILIYMKDMKVLLRTLFVVFMMVFQSVSAVEVKYLYEVEVLSHSKNLKDKKIAIRQGLKIVLSRILAGEKVLQNRTVKKMLRNPMRYVSESQFSLGGNTGKNKGARLLRVLFNEKLLIKVLRAGGNGLWNEIRPRTLVWLVVEQNGRQHFFDAGLMPELDLALSNASKQKKIPVIYPIQDLDEKLSLSMDDVLSAYSGKLLEVSSRYDVVSTLAGKIINKGSCWQAEWTHYFDNKIKQWRSPCGTVSEIAKQQFKGLYDGLSNYYAAKPIRRRKSLKNRVE